MKTLSLTIFVAMCSASITDGQGPSDLLDDCHVPDLEINYQKSMSELIIPTYKAVALHNNMDFVFLPHSTWITLAAIAEGSNSETQQQIFKFLRLPDDPCARQKFYQIAGKRSNSGDDVNIIHSQTLLIDEGVTVNSSWLNTISKNSLLNVVTAPIKTDPVATANKIKEVIVANASRLDLTGNSVLLDAFNYNGLWTTAFADAVVEKAPFYNLIGKQIGTVDLMRSKKKAKMGYVKSVNAKILELPIGSSGRYRLMFFMLLNETDFANFLPKIDTGIVFEMVSSLKESNVPIDIAIPRMKITGEVDMRTVLNYLGIKNIWTDPEATKYISNPPALPSGYIQRATVTIDKHGVAPPPAEPEYAPGTPSGLDPEVGTDFIGNRPFLFSLFDGESYTALVSVAFNTPTYV